MKITREQLPSLYLKRNLSNPRAGEITLDGSIMHILFAVREDQPVSKIAEETGIDETRLANALTKLLELGLVEKFEPEKKYLGDDFFEALHANLKKAVGPAAGFLLKGAMEGTGLSKNSMLKVDGAAVVRSVATEIKDDSARRVFIDSMIGFLR